jgi:hypothetical protein
MLDLIKCVDGICILQFILVYLCHQNIQCKHNCIRTQICAGLLKASGISLHFHLHCVFFPQMRTRAAHHCIKKNKGLLQAHPAQQHFHTFRFTVAPWTRIKIQHTPNDTLNHKDRQPSKVTPLASLCFEVGFLRHTLNKYHGWTWTETIFCR